MTEEEGRAFAKINKWGDPAEWEQSRPTTFANTFGVVDENGQVIPKLHVEFIIYTSPRLHQVKYVFSLMRADSGVLERAYQMEINLRSGLTRDDHAYSHEHYGNNCRLVADPGWAYSSFGAAVERFCQKCFLLLENELPDYEEFKLR